MNNSVSITNSNGRTLRKRRWERQYHSSSKINNSSNVNDDLRLPDGIIVSIGSVSSIAITVNSGNANINVIKNIVSHCNNLKHSSLWRYLRHNLNIHIKSVDNDDEDDDEDEDDNGNDDGDDDGNDVRSDLRSDNGNDNDISIISGLESIQSSLNDNNTTSNTSDLLGLMDDIGANITINSEGMNAALSAQYVLRRITKGTTVGFVGTLLHGNDENDIDIIDEKMVIENYISGTTMIPDAYNNSDHGSNNTAGIDIQLSCRRTENSDECTIRQINLSNNTDASNNISAMNIDNENNNNDNDNTVNDDNNKGTDDNDSTESCIEIGVKGSIFSSDFEKPEINASLINAAYWMVSTKEFLTSHGGHESLVSICNMSTKLQKVLAINLSANISFTKNKESISSIIPHADFLFLSVRGVKKYANYLYENELLGTKETAVRISLQAKATGRRPRILVVCGYQQNTEYGLLICSKAQYYFVPFSLANIFSESLFTIDNEDEISVFMGAFMGRLIHVESQIVTVKDALDKGKTDPQSYLLSTPKEPPLYRPNRRAASYSSSSSLLASKSLERIDNSFSRASTGKLNRSQSRLNTSSIRRGGSPPWDNSTIISPNPVRLESRSQDIKRWGSPDQLGGGNSLFDRSWISDFEGSEVIAAPEKKNSNLSSTTKQRMLNEYPVREGDRARRAFTPSIAFLDSQSYRNDVLKYQPNESNYYSNTNNTNTSINLMFSSNTTNHNARSMASKGTIRFADSAVGLDWPNINAICVGRNGITECCIAGFQAWAYTKNANTNVNSTKNCITIPPKISSRHYFASNENSIANTARTYNSLDSIHS